MALFAMIPLGVGEILGGTIMANVSDKLGYHKTIKNISKVIKIHLIKLI